MKVLVSTIYIGTENFNYGICDIIKFRHLKLQLTI